jgi:acyl-CoA synthetase (AMP-forming)/AMP-acid ligase II
LRASRTHQYEQMSERREAARAAGRPLDPALAAYERQSLWHLIDQRVQATPDAVMAVDERGRTLTFGQCRDRGEALAAALHAQGLRPGATVAWMLPTCLEAFVVVSAFARLDAFQVPMLPIYREREIGFIVREARPELLIVPTVRRGVDYPALAAAATADVPTPPRLLALDENLPGAPGEQLPAPPPKPASPGARWVFYTSGTTSDPKGALHSQSTVAACGTRLIERFGLTEADNNALVFPFTHVGGIAYFIAGLIGGFRHIVIETFSAQTAIETLSREDMTVAGAGPAFWQAYVRAQREHPERRLFPHLRALVGGGAPKPAGLHDEVRGVFGDVPLATGFGLTECPMAVQSSIYEDADTLRSDGVPIPDTEVRIVRTDGTLADRNEVAEIRVNGPMRCLGYLNSALDADGFDEVGFVRTGDLGCLDTAGRLHVTGRLKDIIVRKGENISAKEVEDVLIGHPAVSDVAVIGLPDEERGERCCAVVVLTSGAALTLDGLAEHCRQLGLMRQKIPEQLEIRDELPRNPQGKVLKTVLKEALMHSGTPQGV